MIAEAIKHMLAAGMPHDAIVAAVADMERTLVAVPDPVAERRRAYDRDRRRRERASGECPVDTADKADEPLPDKESFPRTPFKEINLPRERGGRTRGTPLPVNWRPTPLAEGTLAKAAAEKRGRDWVLRAFETFENHWRGKAGRDGRKVDWQATWANWILEQDRRDGSGRNERQGSTNLRGARPDPALDMHRQAQRDIADEERAAAGDTGADTGADLGSWLAIPPGLVGGP